MVNITVEIEKLRLKIGYSKTAMAEILGEGTDKTYSGRIKKGKGFTYEAIDNLINFLLYETDENADEYLYEFPLLRNHLNAIYIASESSTRVIDTNTSLHVDNSQYQIDLLSAKASAGSGIRNYNVDVIGKFPVPIEYFKIKPNLDNLKAIQVAGDSMTPTLNDEDIVIIEEGVEFASDGVYVINMGSELRVKRLIRRIKGIEIKSDNPTYGSEFIENEFIESFNIVGKVRLEIKRY